MNTCIEARTEQRGPFTYSLEVRPDHSESPNSIYGIWEEQPRHVAGETVTYRGYSRSLNGTQWKSINYTPDELGDQYAKQGRENPHEQAYDSLQRELHHYLDGHTLHVRATVSFDGHVLAQDSIKTDFSDHYEGTYGDCAEEMEEMYFDVDHLFEQARDAAEDMCRRLQCA